MTTIGRARNILLNENDTKIDNEISCGSDDSENEIPYHAREHAQPFTYGNLPKDFKRSDLNHVEIEELQETSKSEAVKVLPASSAIQRRDLNTAEELLEPQKVNKTIAVLPPSPSIMRRNGRPSISPSRPVLKKTPSREEFEEMLRERREQSMKAQNYALKEAQNASIQKDLDELQEKLNKRSLHLRQYIAQDAYSDNPCREIVKHVETVDLPDEIDCNRHNRSLMSADVVGAVAKFEPSLIVAEPSRPETPAFPVACQKSSLEDRCVSPYPMVTPGSPSLQRLQMVTAKTREGSSPTKLTGLASSKKQAKAALAEKQISETPHDVAPHLVKFARDSSEYWYKPHLTREEAVALLRQASPGTFVIRNSTTYKNAFGLVLRVSKPPQGVTLSENGSSSDVLVRHFLLEPTTRGVRLKGCTNEPTFTSLSALVYQHSINKLALPCKLLIPTRDLLLSPEDAELVQSQKQLLEQGAACNVLYLFSMNMESLTGDEAIRRTVNEMYAQRTLPSPIEVHFKVSQNGITLTDNKRRIFFRRHYAPNNISHIAMDPDSRFFSMPLQHDNGFERTVNKFIFAFVARPSTGGRDNQCHIFCDLAVTQPASAIVSFAHKVLSFKNKNNHQML